MALTRNMVSSLVLPTSIASRMPDGTSLLHSVMIPHEPAMRLTIFLVPCMTSNTNVNYCNLIMMASPPKGNLNHYRCYNRSGSGWNKITQNNCQNTHS